MQGEKSQQLTSTTAIIPKDAVEKRDVIKTSIRYHYRHGFDNCRFLRNKKIKPLDRVKKILVEIHKTYEPHANIASQMQILL